MSNSKFRCPTCKGYFRIGEEHSSNGLSRFCSAECSNGRSSMKTTSTGSTRPVRSDEPTDATKALVDARDGRRCRMCGSTRNLARHHIRYRSEFGRRKVDHSETNLILLCQRHHDQVHSDKHYWQPVCLAYVWLRYTTGKSTLRLHEVELLLYPVD